jgi:hypothetical protein
LYYYIDTIPLIIVVCTKTVNKNLAISTYNFFQYLRKKKEEKWRESIEVRRRRKNRQSR